MSNYLMLGIFEKKEFINKKNQILVLVVFHLLDACSQALVGHCDCRLLHVSARYCLSISHCDS